MKRMKQILGTLTVMLMLSVICFCGSIVKAADDGKLVDISGDIASDEDFVEDTNVNLADELAYIVIDRDFVTTPGTQYVVVGVGNDNTLVESATLYYVNTGTGKEYTKICDVISGNAALFDLDFNDESATGTYEIKAVEVTINGVAKRLPANVSGTVSFGVNQEINTNPDYVVAPLDEAEANSIIISDSTDDVASADDIAKAVAAANPRGSLNATADNGQYIVVLDPGHGGYDGGACYNGLAEKDVNLKIAQYCKKQLEKYVGVKVYMTRNDDSYLELSERTDYGKKVGADLFISIHNNASSNTGVRGASVYYPNMGLNSQIGTAGSELAAKIQDKLVALGLYNGGTHTRDYSTAGGATHTEYYSDGSVMDYYAIVRYSKLNGFPGLIIEHAYISNPDDAAAFLSSEESLKKLGVADAKAIKEYLGLSTNPTTKYGAIDYSPVYDFDYYVKKYSDVKKKYANDPTGALIHFVTTGVKEGRQACEDFDVNSYRLRYSDLRKEYGTNLVKYYVHYVLYGKEEGRDGSKEELPEPAKIESKYLTVYNGVDYSTVYDYEYYLKKYPSVEKKVGKSQKKVLENFVTEGMPKGRRGSKNFDVKSYYNAHTKLRDSFKKDWEQYYIHYMYYGYAEGLKATGVKTLQNPTTVYNKVDYSAVYNYDYYTTRYPSVIKKVGTGEDEVLQHFLTVGMKNAYRGCKDFDVKSYRNANADLRAKYKENWAKYYNHYVVRGKKEKRVCKNVKEILELVTVYNGVDYSAVYDYNYYLNKYSSVKKKVGTDEYAVLEHFVTVGMKKAYRGCKDFDVKSYRNANADLRAKYKDNWSRYYNHYVTRGKKEKRVCKNVKEILEPVTIYKGVDYSAVYDYNYYLNKYPSVKKKIGTDEYAVLEHFVTVGIKNAHRGKKDFDVKSYRNANADLRMKYGNNWSKYYKHYITRGKKEKRVCTGVKQITEYGSSYGGVDYSSVYNYSYYVANNPDVAEAYSGDDRLTLLHFINHGMAEGRQASDEFNVKIYKSNYSELSAAYGNDYKQYYIHYINYGKSEGRVANSYLPGATKNMYKIMGETTTTVNQMVAYYNANAVYPSFYSNSDAPTIKKFCKIYYDECKAEGVRAEVAFCQAMKETGFLRFGGQVSIEQYNFAGMGATDDGAAGASFSSVRQGIRAQVQHLKAYASTAPLNKKCVDPRFSLVRRGSAKYVEWLGIQENPYGGGWASALNYGGSLRSGYIAKLKKYPK